MPLPIVIAENQTATDIPITDLGVSILANQSLNLTDLFTFWEISSSIDIEMYIAGGGLLINDGTNTLDLQASLNYINITGNVNGDSTATSNQVAVFSGTGGNRINGSLVTISGSGDISVPGQVELGERTSVGPAGVSEGVLWVKNTTPNELHFTDNQGTDINLSQAANAALFDIEAADSLTLNIAEDSHEEIIKTNGKVSSVIVWKTSNKLTKIRESTFSRVNGRISSIIIKQYDASGQVIIGQTLEKTISRDTNGFVKTIDNTES